MVQNQRVATAATAQRPTCLRSAHSGQTIPIGNRPDRCARGFKIAQLPAAPISADEERREKIDKRRTVWPNWKQFCAHLGAALYPISYRRSKVTIGVFLEVCSTMIKAGCLQLPQRQAFDLPADAELG
jgi:hypothetical protein